MYSSFDRSRLYKVYGIYFINISPSLYLIVNCGVPILGESSSSLEEWRSLLGQSGCHGGERFSKEIWGQGVPWAETYGVFVLICWLRVPSLGWMFVAIFVAGFQPWSGLRAKREANTPVVGRLKQLLIGWDPCTLNGKYGGIAGNPWEDAIHKSSIFFIVDRWLISINLLTM